MKALALRLRRLTPAEGFLLAEATLALAIAALAIATIPFRRLTSMVRPPAAMDRSLHDDRETIDTVRWAIGACSRRVPWRAKCLEQAFAAQWMLRRRSVPAIVHYGVAKQSEVLAAHAWVRAGRLEVIGCENADEFTEVARFPDVPAQ